jgi:hypothetical protein
MGNKCTPARFRSQTQLSAAHQLAPSAIAGAQPIYFPQNRNFCAHSRSEIMRNNSDATEPPRLAKPIPSRSTPEALHSSTRRHRRRLNSRRIELTPKGSNRSMLDPFAVHTDRPWDTGSFAPGCSGLAPPRQNTPDTRGVVVSRRPARYTNWRFLVSQPTGTDLRLRGRKTLSRKEVDMAAKVSCLALFLAALVPTLQAQSDRPAPQQQGADRANTTLSAINDDAISPAGWR